MSISRIIWDSSPAEAVRSYIVFQLKVLATLGINLPKTPNDPIALSHRWLSGQVTRHEFLSARDEWWDIIDARGWIQEFRVKDAALARLSLCLLAVSEDDAQKLGDHLSWFLEVLGFLGADTQKAVMLMKQEFKFFDS